MDNTTNTYEKHNELLRQAIWKSEEDIFKLSLAMYTFTGVILTIIWSKDTIPNPILLSVIFVIAIPFSAKISTAINFSFDVAGYLIVFIEPYTKGMEWQTHLYQSYVNSLTKTIKTAPIKRLLYSAHVGSVLISLFISIYTIISVYKDHLNWGVLVIIINLLGTFFIVFLYIKDIKAFQRRTNCIRKWYRLKQSIDNEQVDITVEGLLLQAENILK